jgi:hypothetical protein
MDELPVLVLVAVPLDLLEILALSAAILVVVLVVVAVLLVVVLLVLVAEEDNYLIYPGLLVSLDFGFTLAKPSAICDVSNTGRFRSPTS